MMVALETFGYLPNMKIITIVLCHVVGTGGLVLYLSHMLHHCDNSVMSTAAAYWILFGIGCMKTSFMFIFFNSRDLAVTIYLGIYVAFTLCHYEGGFACSRKIVYEHL